MATIVGDVTGLQQRHYPQNIPHLVEEIKGEILQHIKNSGEGFGLQTDTTTSNIYGPTMLGVVASVCM